MIGPLLFRSFELHDRFELEDSLPVSRAVHRSFRFYQSFQTQYAHFHIFNFNKPACPLDLVVIAKAVYKAQTVQLTYLRIEIQIFKLAGCLLVQLKLFPPRRHSVHRVQIRECFLQGEQIGRREIAADIDVLSNVRTSVNDACKTSYDNEIHAGLSYAFKQIYEIAAHNSLAFRSFSAVLSAI